MLAVEALDLGPRALLVEPVVFDRGLGASEAMLELCCEAPGRISPAVCCPGFFAMSGINKQASGQQALENEAKKRAIAVCIKSGPIDATPSPAREKTSLDVPGVYCGWLKDAQPRELSRRGRSETPSSR